MSLVLVPPTAERLSPRHAAAGDQTSGIGATQPGSSLAGRLTARSRRSGRSPAARACPSGPASAIGALEELGIAREFTGRKRYRHFAYEPWLAVLEEAAGAEQAGAERRGIRLGRPRGPGSPRDGDLGR